MTHKLITIYFDDQIPSGTSQMKRTNRRTGVFFDAPSVAKARRIYKEKLEPCKLEKPIEGAVAATFIFKYSTKTKKKIGTYKTSRPDTDNLVKLLIDVMTGLGFWKDDAQIAELRIIKKYSRTACIDMSIRSMED